MNVRIAQAHEVYTGRARSRRSLGDRWVPAARVGMVGEGPEMSSETLWETIAVTDPQGARLWETIDAIDP
jgi:hypothetical protein